MKKPRTLRRWLLPLMLLCLVLPAAACGAKKTEPEPAPPLSEIARITASEGSDSVTVDIVKEVPTVDLTELEERGPIQSLTVNCRHFSLDKLILPGNVELVGLDLTDATNGSTQPHHTLQCLDASKATALRGLHVYSEGVQSVIPCDSLEVLTTPGESLETMSAFSSVKNLTLTSWAELTPLSRFPHLEDLSFMTGIEESAWDLTPIRQLSLQALRFHSHAALSPHELAGLAGASIPFVQLSDWGIHDISFLDAMPDTNTLLLQVGEGQPSEVKDAEGQRCTAEVAALVDTRIPKEQLVAFASDYELYLFERINDNVPYPG